MPEVPRRGYFRIDLADNCNIRCIMCQAYNSLPVSDMKFLDYESFVANTRGELEKWDYVQLGNVAEATIHPRFADFVRYIRAEAPQTCIHIVTNGKTLHRYAELINEAGNCIVQISMDSVRRETHEYIREGSNFNRALENIAMLDPSRTRVLLSFTLMRSNVGQYGEIVEFCRERDYSMSAFPMILRAESGVIPYNLLKESLWFNLDLLRTWLRQFYGVQYERMVGTACGASPWVADFACNAHYQDLNMDSAGTVNLCGKLTLGSLTSTTLRDLWRSFEADEFRIQVETDRGPCMTCDYRQRCTSPSMALMDNHFSEELAATITPETRQKIGYERTISDDEARWYFVRDIGHSIFEIRGSDRQWVAKKVTPLETPGTYGYGEPMTAGSRHELHDMMRRDTDSDLYAQLLEAFGKYNLVKYRGKYWALPRSLGPLNLASEPDRNKPGILVAPTLEELKERCGDSDDDPLPRLVGTLNGYNLVTYQEKFWAIPLTLGTCDITQPHNQNCEGVRAAESLDGLWRLCGAFEMLAAPTSAELKQRCGDSDDDPPPRLIESLNGYNLVAYQKKYWGIPVALGPCDLVQPKNRSRQGIQVADSLDGLRSLCRVFRVLGGPVLRS